MSFTYDTVVHSDFLEFSHIIKHLLEQNLVTIHNNVYSIHKNNLIIEVDIRNHYWNIFITTETDTLICSHRIDKKELFYLLKQ
jgi:hypothetical protein